MASVSVVDVCLRSWLAIHPGLSRGQLCRVPLHGCTPVSGNISVNAKMEELRSLTCMIVVDCDPV
jgi:hypothetical protein